MPNLRMANNAELKNVVKAIADAASLGGEVSKGFSFDEIAKGYALSQEAKQVFNEKAILLPEWEGMDDEARADLVAFANANVKIPESMDAEKYVKLILASAVALSAVVAPWLS